MNQTYRRLNKFLGIDIYEEFGDTHSDKLIDYVDLEKTEAYRDALKELLQFCEIEAEYPENCEEVRHFIGARLGQTQLAERYFPLD